MFNIPKNIPDGRVMVSHVIKSSKVDIAGKLVDVIIRSWQSDDDCLSNNPNWLEFTTSIDFVEWNPDILLNLETIVLTLDWQYYNNEFVPPPPFDLKSARDEKDMEIEQWRTTARYANVHAEIDGTNYEWQADSNSQTLITQAIQFAVLGIQACPPLWRTFDNIDVVITLDDLKKIASAMAQQTSYAYFHSFELKALVDVATTQAELDAITWL